MIMLRNCLRVCVCMSWRVRGDVCFVVMYLKAVYRHLVIMNASSGTSDDVYPHDVEITLLRGISGVSYIVNSFGIETFPF